jgi:hypothetical protein
MPWKRMQATGSANEDLWRRIDYLVEENRVLRNQIDKRVLLTDCERRTLAGKAVALRRHEQNTNSLGHQPSCWNTLFPLGRATIHHVTPALPGFLR